MHVPVLLEEVLAYLNVRSGKQYIDATLGMGGHAQAIAAAGGKVLGIDRDRSVLGAYEHDFPIVFGRFTDLEEIVKSRGFQQVAGILFDLGLGSHQLDDPERGFSFQKHGPLDMRFEQQGRTAADIVNNSPEKELRRIFEKYGEEKQFSRKIVRGIVKRRSEAPLTSTTELFDLIKKALPAKLRFRAGDVARRIFQALRIEINQELDELKAALPQTLRLLERGGRLVVISFHSLEDRIVKDFMNYEAKDCVCPPEVPVCRCDKQARLKILTKKPQTASEEEIAENPRSKSAKLRAAEKIS